MSTIEPTAVKHWWQRARSCAECGTPLAGLRNLFAINGDYCSEACRDVAGASSAW
jgi:hypothetical protein